METFVTNVTNLLHFSLDTSMEVDRAIAHQPVVA